MLSIPLIFTLKYLKLTKQNKKSYETNPKTIICTDNYGVIV